MRTMSPLLTRLGGAAAAVTLLSACSGNMQSQVAPSTATSSGVTSYAGNAAKSVLSPWAFRGPLPAVQPDHKKSWISPDAKNRGNANLYVSNLGTDDVTIYTYKNNGLKTALSGTLTGFTEPAVPCADAKGNVFIPDYGTGKIYEYAYGATTPSQTLTDPNGAPVSCSVDPSTGNLAVADFAPSAPSGTVSIYTQATGSPATVSVSSIAHPAFVGYTPTGALYVDGLDSTATFAIAMAPAGSNTFSAVSITGGVTLYSPGAIVWGGSYLLVGDQTYQNTQTSAVYQLCTCGGATLQYKGQAVITGSTDVIGFWKRGSGNTARIIAPDYGNPANGVAIYNPVTQAITANITDSVSQPVGATISQKGK
jgi:hypothetical protein